MPLQNFWHLPGSIITVHFLSLIHTDRDLTGDIVFTRIHLSSSFSLISLTTHISPDLIRPQLHAFSLPGDFQI
ncbi:hypothetical protein HanRHA438_Chr16g0746961 [Helianthus annuus]|nr:hypothetical protein HanRHA438_Chr16g0746961 [Helianthus annuus]